MDGHGAGLTTRVIPCGRHAWSGGVGVRAAGSQQVLGAANLAWRNGKARRRKRRVCQKAAFAGGVVAAVIGQAQNRDTADMRMSSVSLRGIRGIAAVRPKASAARRHLVGADC
jgi:hypothetical protein